MPVLALIGIVHSQSPQQNATGVMVGQFNSSGWDANMKMNLAQGGNFGVFSRSIAALNMTFDQLELMDGVIIDSDIKPAMNANV